MTSTTHLADLHDVPVLDSQRVQELLRLFSLGVQNTLVSINGEVERTKFLQIHKGTIGYGEGHKQTKPHSPGQAAAA